MKKTENKTTEQKNIAPIVDETAKTAAELLDELNAVTDENIRKTIVVQLAEVLKSENKAATKTAIRALVTKYAEDQSAFWTELVNNPYAPILKLKENEDGNFELTPGKRRILFSQVDHAYGEDNNGRSIAQSKNYHRMFARLTNNLYKATCAELSEEAKAVIRVKYHGKDEEMAVDFTGTSIGALLAQVQAIVDTIFPADQTAKMVRADVRYLLKAFTNAKEGEVKTANEKKVEAAVLDAFRVRKAEQAYKVTSTAKCHKEPKVKAERSEAVEEQTSRIPERPEAVDTVKKAAKKSKTQAA